MSAAWRTRIRRSPTTRFRRWLPLLGLALFALALWLLHHELGSITLSELVAQVRAFPAPTLAVAVLLTAASYLVLTGYDTLSLRILGHPLPYRQSALAAFLGFSFSQTAGLTLVSGAPVRFRLYGSWGLSAFEVTALVLLNGVSFWLGLVGVVGVTLLLAGRIAPGVLQLPFASLRPLGAVFLALVAAYVVTCWRRRRPLHVGRWKLDLPRPGIAVAQLAVGAADWVLSAAVLFVLLPPGLELGFLHVLGVYAVASLLGFVSQVPGGLGVFESVVLLLFGSSVPHAALAGTLLVYRATYFLLPFVVSTTVLAGFELRERRRGVARVARVVGTWLHAAAPPLLAFGTFLAGTTLVLTGALPAYPARLQWLDRLLPLSVLELSHFAGSVVGVALLLLAWGLLRRLEGAWHVAVILLASGAALAILRSGSWETALALVALLAVLAAAHSQFYRRTSLLAEPLSGGWIAAVLMVMAGSIWLGLFSFQHVAYSKELWWRFALTADAPRFLRAEVGAALAMVVFGLAHLLRPGRPRELAVAAGEESRVAPIVERSPEAFSNLARLGDKRFLLSESGDAFVMFGVEGRSWIAMGDPVGPTSAHADLIWRFHGLAGRHGGTTVFYEVADRNLEIYLELGLSLLKLGEEAVVDLAAFSLEGSRHKTLRYEVRHLKREGCAVDVVPPDGVAPLLPELRAVSDAWMAEHKAREKGFSLGRFDEAYLTQLPVAVVRQHDRIVAFAVLWPGAPGGELGVDLMRHLPDAPNGAMDLLFADVMAWGRDAGYAVFSLGMAPFSGLRGGTGAGLWNRLGALLYSHGEAVYNFRGVRRFKDKFDPAWRPRYLACPGGAALPGVVADLFRHISGGLRGTIRG